MMKCKNELSKIEEKVLAFNSASLFPARKWEAVTQGRTRMIDNPKWRSQYRQKLGGQVRPLVHSRYIHVKQE